MLKSFEEMRFDIQTVHFDLRIFCELSVLSKSPAITFKSTVFLLTCVHKLEQAKLQKSLPTNCNIVATLVEVFCILRATNFHNSI